MPSMVSYVIGLAMLVLIGTGGYYLMTKQAAAPSDATVASTEATDADAQAAAAGKATTPAATTVVYTDKGFTPETVTVKVGSKVRFFNQSKEKMWVQADPANAKTNYAGLPEFDQNTSVNNGVGWEFTFNQVGSWSYRNQNNSKMVGKVIVTK